MVPWDRLEEVAAGEFPNQEADLAGRCLRLVVRRDRLEEVAGAEFLSEWAVELSRHF
jgi:hypothetical protein